MTPSFSLPFLLLFFYPLFLFFTYCLSFLTPTPVLSFIFTPHLPTLIPPFSPFSSSSCSSSSFFTQLHGFCLLFFFFIMYSISISTLIRSLIAFPFPLSYFSSAHIQSLFFYLSSLFFILFSTCTVAILILSFLSFFFLTSTLIQLLFLLSSSPLSFPFLQ